MIYWDNYKSHTPDIVGTRKKVDNNIYTFDIETTSYLILDNEIISSYDYQKLSKSDRDRCLKFSNMYIWQFSINDVVYYGRTWGEFISFLDRLDNNIPERKIIFVHNLAFEFQYLKNVISFKEVTARKAHKVMTALASDYNILFKCSYMMSNSSLAGLPKLFRLPVEKKVGDLDYKLLRHSSTPLTKEELGYCEYDCLVVYHYIKRELETYERVDKIPTTSTGKVRRELKEETIKDYKYRRLVYKATNTNPHIYNLLLEAFMGGYTHSNWIYADEIIKDVTSFDFTSSYPYVLVSHKYPSSEFRICNIKKRDDMSKKLCYLLVVKFTNIKCKYYNNFISASKCRNIKGAKYDNGRIIEAKEIIITLTDIDFYFILDTYNCSYEILESYYSNYNYLPKKFINFILQKYVNKTEYKDVDGMELEYQKEKNKFNALYGMSVTNMIRDNVIYDDNSKEWREEELTNDEIIEKLVNEKKKCFLSFAYGVWCTAYARNNLLRNLIKLDEYVLYSDTDSLKLRNGFDINVIDNYNKYVEKKIKRVSEDLNIPIKKFAPKDKKGVSHMLGVFEKDASYLEFKTMGAKKYAYIKYKDNEKIKKDDNVIEVGENKSKVLEITISGVPKNGAKAIKSLEDFKSNFIFRFEDTNKLTLIYSDNQFPVEMTDYLGNKKIVDDVSGCCLLPATYELSMALDYANLVNDNSSKRAIYKEE